MLIGGTDRTAGMHMCSSSQRQERREAERLVSLGIKKVVHSDVKCQRTANKMALNH